MVLPLLVIFYMIPNSYILRDRIEQIFLKRLQLVVTLVEVVITEHFPVILLLVIAHLLHQYIPLSDLCGNQLKVLVHLILHQGFLFIVHLNHGFGEVFEVLATIGYLFYQLVTLLSPLHLLSLSSQPPRLHNHILCTLQYFLRLLRVFLNSRHLLSTKTLILHFKGSFQCLYILTCLVCIHLGHPFIEHLVISNCSVEVNGRSHRPSKSTNSIKIVLQLRVNLL